MSICMSRKCVPVSGDGPRGPEPMSPCLPAERLSRWAKPAEVPGRGIRQFQFACFCVHFSVQKMLPVSGDGRRGLEPTSLCLPAERLYRWAKLARYPWYETILVCILFGVLFSATNVCRLLGIGEEDSNQLPSVYQLSVFTAGPNRQGTRGMRQFRFMDVLFSPENVTRLVGTGEEDPNQLPSVYQRSVFPAGPNPW